MKNIDSNILSALIGAAVSLLVLIFTIFWDRISNWLSDRNKRRKKLIYAAALIKPIIVYSKEQAQNIEIFASALLKTPHEFPLLTFAPKNDIEKFIQTVDDENFFDAYTANYSPYWTSVREFKGISASIGFQNLQMEQVLEMVKTSRDFDYERKMKFKNALKSATNLAATAIADQTLQQHSGFLSLLDQSLASYVTNRPSPSDIKYAHDAFVKPVIQAILDNQYYHIPIGHQIISILHEASEVYFDIIMQMESMKDDLFEILKKYNQSNETLITHSQSLLNDYFEKG